MKKTPTLLTWTIWTPLKFALISFAIITMLSLIYSVIHNIVFSNTPQMPSVVLGLTAIGFIAGVYLSIRKLPHIKMDRPSFIAIHNAQVLWLFILFAISTYLLLSNQQEIMYGLMMYNGANSGKFLLLIILIALYYLFLFGLAIINFYVKIRRIQQFNIPTWKIVCSFPFGFGMLWTPGYLLETKHEKNPSQPIKSKWYSRITNWALGNQINTISMFVFITVLSGFFLGFTPILLTFTLALIFGLWSLQIGTKKFIKNMHQGYATTAVVINIIMIIVFSCVYAFAPKQNIELTISETQIITTQGH